MRIGLAVAALAAVLVFPALEAGKARANMSPYKVEGNVNAAMRWLADRPPTEDGTHISVYSVGLWNWDAFLVPYLSGRPLIDGWHDEGARNVHKIRQLRIMGWTGEVNIQEAHRLLTELGATYVLVDRISDYQAEASDVFWDEIESRPDLFTKEEQWGDVATFRVSP